MKSHLTLAQTQLHEHAVACGRGHRRSEAALVLAIQDVGRTGLWRKFDRRSLFAYAVGELGLTDSVAGACVRVARKAMQVPALQAAIAEGRMSVSLASRLIGCLTVENSEEVIAFALAHTCREVDEDCARRNPEKDARDRAKPTGNRRIKLTVTVSKETYKKVQRVQSLEARCGRDAGLERALEAAAEEYLARRDPVRKAERAQAKPRPRAAGKPCTYNGGDDGPIETKVTAPPPGRVPLTAAQKHAVYARDGGRCAHVGESGRRCGADRWVDVHPVGRGGGNEPSNLTTLCSYHHDLVHQTSFPIDGQVSWIRARSVEYRV